MNIFQRFDRWKAKRRTFRELNDLNDKELNDIGISRGDIKRIADTL